MSEELTAKVIEAGNVRYEEIGGTHVHELKRGVIVQFDTVEQFKRAVNDGAPVKFEWR